MTDEVITEETLAEAVGPQSPLEALRVRREEVANRREILIGIPAYEDNGLKVKYRLIGRDETDEIAKRVRKQTRDRSEFLYRVVLDTMINACVGFYWARNGTPDELAEPVEDEAGNFIESFRQMADALAWVPAGDPTQRQAALFVFADNEFSLGTHGMQLQRWLNNTNLEVDEDFLQD